MHQQAAKPLGIDIRIGGSDPRMDAFADYLRSMFPEASVSRWTVPANAVAGSRDIDLAALWLEWSAAHP